MRPLIVGAAPSRTSNPRKPLSGTSGRRLAALCGLSFPAFLRAFERVNLLDCYPGRRGDKGDELPRFVARLSACNLTPRLRQRRTVLLGRGVARAFHMHDRPFFVWHDDIGDGALVAVAPHPSGVSLFWNDAENVDAARRFWRALAAERP